MQLRNSVQRRALNGSNHSSKNGSRWLAPAVLLVTLNGCGGSDHFAPLGTDPGGAVNFGGSSGGGSGGGGSRGGGSPGSAGSEATSPSGAGTSSAGSGQTTSITEVAPHAERGMLELLAQSALKRGLGKLQFEVTNAAGTIVAHGYNDVQGADAERRLLLQLPAATGYQLALESTTGGKSPTACRAAVGPFSVEPNATVGLQAFIWQCDGGAPQDALGSACYWLADWVSMTRTRAPIGQTIVLSVSGHDSLGDPVHVNWTNKAPRLGELSDKHAATTAFTCLSAASSIPLQAVLSGDDCTRQLDLNVACY